MNAPFQFHKNASVCIAATPDNVFAVLDDHRRLADHMAKPTLMMACAAMKIEMDRHRGQAMGSQIRMHGRVLGMALSVEETVIEYIPSVRKIWETSAKPNLLVIGRYRMGFELIPQS